MPKPRKALVSLSATPFYHCTSRCVRRAFLCGKDSFTGKSFEHRRQWIEDRMLYLSTVFAIDVCAYAVMSNHYHIVLHIDEARASSWTVREVIARWHSLYKGHLLSQRYEAGEVLDGAELEALNSLVNIWRDRLKNISWFSGLLKERIAREANKEDEVTGRFWEGRFKCDALLDEKALAVCMVYVDLNPVRAKMADSPEQSDHTSIKQRIEKAGGSKSTSNAAQQPIHLMPFAGYPRAEMLRGLPFRLSDYLELVDWTGRIIRQDKRGAVDQNLPPILQRLQIDPKEWCYSAQHFESRFSGLVGLALKVERVCRELGQQWARGIRACRVAFPT